MKPIYVSCKYYRNILLTQLKRNKQNYFIFQDNIKDLKNAWKGIKKIISLNRSNHGISTAIAEKKGNKIITNSSEITDTFNYYFAKVSIDVHPSIQFSKK